MDDPGDEVVLVNADGRAVVVVRCIEVSERLHDGGPGLRLAERFDRLLHGQNEAVARRRADIVAFSLERTRQPYLDPDMPIMDAFLARGMGEDTEMTMVDGRVLYLNGNYTDTDIGVLEAGRRFRDQDFAKTTWDSKNFNWAPSLGKLRYKRRVLYRFADRLDHTGIAISTRRIQ